MASVSLQELEKATTTLDEALKFVEQVKGNDVQYKIARDASIQRFEYCIELAWKVSVKKLGSQTKFPKPAVREMARGNLIDSAIPWLAFIDARNDTSHSYDENVAQKVFAQVLLFSKEISALLERLRKMP